jgi:HTH-type transcriptional regulator/antitoxin HigA
MEGVAMLASEMQKAAKVWPSISDILFVPHTERDYKALVSFLDNLVDEVGQDERHPLASLMEVVAVLIEKYEDEYVPQLAEQ